MNFQDLFNKIKAIDEGTSVAECGPMSGAPAPALKPAPGDDILTGECGGDMPGDMMRPPVPKQSDSVTMNVSINGSGAGGIRDLMDVLKDIQDGPGHGGHDAPLQGSNPIEIAFDETQEDGGFTNATTTPDQQVSGIEMVTPMGNDLSSKGGEAEKVNGGGNPLNVDESLVSRLQAHYASIKESSGVDEGMWDTIKQGAQSAVQGAQNLGQQAVQGAKNVANTVANTTVGDLATKYNPGVQLAKGVANAAQTVGNQVKQVGQGVVNANKAALGAVGNAAQAIGQKVAGAVAPAPAPMAPVAGVVPGAEFGDIGKGAEFGDLPPQAQFGDLPPQGGRQAAATDPRVVGKAATAPATAPAAKPASMSAIDAAFGESEEMSDIRKLAGL